MILLRTGVAFLLVSLLAAPALAQTDPAPAAGEAPPAAEAKAADAVEPISDNSFFLEEAYNQDAGVVQHIFTLQRSLRGPAAWGASLTQEWPLGGLAHQISYSIPLLSEDGGGTGVGDIAISYRYQLAGDGSTRYAVTPRATVLLPTGSASDGRGAGALGVNAAIALSAAVTPRLMAHTNAGVVFTPKAEDASGNEADLSGVSVGQSVVFLYRPMLNFMLEAVWQRAGSVAGAGVQEKQNAFVVSPGVRWGYNRPSGLQIVPGIAFPLGFGPSSGERAVFVYLSLEHPFRRSR